MQTAQVVTLAAPLTVTVQGWLSGTAGDRFVGVQRRFDGEVEVEEVGALGVFKEFVRGR
jgi:hypothetical protein